MEGVATSESQKSKSISLLTSYFIINQGKIDLNNKYCIDSEKFIYTQYCNSNTQKFQVLIKLRPCIILKLF